MRYLDGSMCGPGSLDGAYLPHTLIKFLVSVDADTFPNITILLVLGCTLPATSAETERSSSVLRLIKSHLRSRMADTRFSALTFMKMHCSKHTDPKQIADRFIKEHPRHLFKATLESSF